MKSTVLVVCAVAILSACNTNTRTSQVDPRTLTTNALCQAWVNSGDHVYRLEVAKVLVGRGASVEKCNRLVATDNAIMTGIAVAGAGVAVGAAAANNGYGGGYYPQPGAYGVAWDQFNNQYYQPIWRCRDRATGQFVDDYRCAGMPMHDATWPGWSA